MNPFHYRAFGGRLQVFRSGSLLGLIVFGKLVLVPNVVRRVRYRIRALFPAFYLCGLRDCDSGGQIHRWIPVFVWNSWDLERKIRAFDGMGDGEVWVRTTVREWISEIRDQRARARKALAVLAAIFLVGCAAPPENYTTLGSIAKDDGVVSVTAVESTPFVHNGQLRLGVWDRTKATHSFDVYDFESRALLSSHHFPYMFGSLIVVGSRVYVFGSEVNADGSTFPGNAIVMSSTEDFVSWTAPAVVLRAPSDTRIYNTSVAQISGGSFAMAYEISTPQLVDFSFRFATSANLTSWTTSSAVFSPNEYAGCPTLRFSNGTFKMLYLRSRGGKYVTFAASGPTFDTIVERRAVFSPDAAEGTNNSDVDWIEYQGETFFSYAIGDQFTWAGIKTARYPGTQEQFFNELGL